MSSKSRYIPPLGEVRHSQLLTTYGPGSMVDLPEQSVVIGGLNLWWYDRNDDRSFISEPRLIAKIRSIPELNVSPSLQLRRPPLQDEGPDGRRRSGGIRAPQFPNWFVAQTKEPLTHEDSRGRLYRTRPLVEGTRLEKGKYRFLAPDGKRQNLDVVPVRFVQCCPNGHLSDLDWRTFAHEGQSTTCQEPLWLDEAGAGNDFNEIYVRCDKCNTRRALAKSKDEDGKSILGKCRGHRPWLGNWGTEGECLNPDGKPNYNRLLVRSASNAYYPELISAISIPAPEDPISEVLTANLSLFEKVDSVGKLELYLELCPEWIAAALRDFDVQTIFEALQAARGGDGRSSRKEPPLKEQEIQALYGSARDLGEPGSESSFYAEPLDLTGKPAWFRSRFNRVLKVHRLREVMALIGFTRLEPVVKGVDGDPLDLGVKRAAIHNQDLTWVPAVENFGEGIFLGVDPQAIEAWRQLDAVQAYSEKHRSAFKLWNRDNGLKEEDFAWPGPEYLMLHSLAHLLITTAALECGYGASAIKERIYAFRDKGYGILLYTGGSGSEGTLGGLVALADRIESLVAQALESGRLCSNDPFCSMHDPENPFEQRYSHGAACHGCLLIAETSCEQRNQFLDRAFVVGTLSETAAAFFPELLQ